MKLFSDKKTIASLLIFTALITLLPCPGWGLAKASAPTFMQLQINSNTTVDYVYGNNVVLKEKISDTFYKIDVLDRTTYKVSKTYPLKFDKSVQWNRGVNSRYAIISKVVYDRQSTLDHYWLDLLSGEYRKVVTTTGNYQITPFTSGVGVLVKENSQYTVINPKLNRVITGIDPVKWDPTSDYMAYFNQEGLLQLLNVKTMEATSIPGLKNTDFIATDTPSPWVHSVTLINGPYILPKDVINQTSRIEDLNFDGVFHVKTGLELKKGILILGWTPDLKGVIYAEDSQIKYFTADYYHQVIGPFEPINFHPSTTEAVCANPEKTKIIIQDGSNRAYVLDLKKTVFESVYPKPFSAAKIVWGPQGAIYYTYQANSAEHYYSTGFYKSENGKIVNSGVGDYMGNPIFFKNRWVFFPTDLELPGHFDYYIHGIGIYDLKTGQYRKIPGSSIGVTPDGTKVVLDGYYLEEGTWKLTTQMVKYAPMQGPVINGKVLTYYVINGDWYHGNKYQTAFDHTTGKWDTNLSKVKIDVFDAVGHSVAIYGYVSKNRIYLYNGKKLWYKTTNGQILKTTVKPTLTPDEKDYYYVVKLKDKYYFVLSKVG